MVCVFLCVTIVCCDSCFRCDSFLVLPMQCLQLKTYLRFTLDHTTIRLRLHTHTHTSTRTVEQNTLF